MGFINQLITRGPHPVNSYDNFIDSSHAQKSQQAAGWRMSWMSSVKRRRFAADFMGLKPLRIVMDNGIYPLVVNDG